MVASNWLHILRQSLVLSVMRFEIGTLIHLLGAHPVARAKVNDFLKEMHSVPLLKSICFCCVSICALVGML